MGEQNSIRTVIVDDDLHAIEILKGLIGENCPEFEIIATANDIIEGVQLILHENPDLLFLDIEMPGGSGFDLLSMLPERNFEVVFITAHNKYAIRAIKYSALDYLLKPFDKKEFIKTIGRIKLNGVSKTRNYEVLLENLSGNSPKKLIISNARGYEYIPVNDIIRIESERSYAQIYLNNKRKILVSKCLNDYQKLLDDNLFFRVHNSHLINLNHVIRYVKTDGGYVEMTDGNPIPISRSKKEIFLNKMQNFIS